MFIRIMNYQVKGKNLSAKRKAFPPGKQTLKIFYTFTRKGA
jgi:hypothetical protein